MPTIEERLMALEVEFKYISEKLDGQNEDVKKIKNILAQASGGWRAIALVGGISATIGGLLAKFGSFLF
jgi:hypothetical protein